MQPDETLNAWQPIETAPFDTDVVIGFWNHERPVDWAPAEWVQVVAHQWKPGRWYARMFGHMGTKWRIQHWMPLPEPPKE